jgi:hypothetical protein
MTLLQTGTLTEEAVLASLGCGNPTALAQLHEGETVLDLGSGGGIDVLLLARQVGCDTVRMLNSESDLPPYPTLSTKPEERGDNRFCILP